MPHECFWDPLEASVGPDLGSCPVGTTVYRKLNREQVATHKSLTAAALRATRWRATVTLCTGGRIRLRTGADKAFVEAAQLAAYFSAGRENGKVEVDYTELKNVKKPGGAKPGFVVYYTNYSMVADAICQGGVSSSTS